MIPAASRASPMRLLAGAPNYDLVLVAAAVAVVTVVVLHRWIPLPRRLLWTAAVLALLITFGGLYVARGLDRDSQEDARESAVAGLGGSHAGPTDGPASHADLWAVGDGADGHPPARDVARLMARTDPDRILMLGDVYGPYGPTLDDAYGDLVSRFAPTPGNHDFHRPSQISSYLSYWSRHGLGPATLYYTFRTAGWQIISVNSEVPQEKDSAQLAWLRRVVSAPGDCRIAFWHRPRFSAGRHGDQQNMDRIWRILRGHAVLVLSGHDHDMQRLRPIDGIVQMVVGSGGHSHYPLHADDRLAFGDDTHDGALHLTLTPGHAHFEFTATSGSVLDSGNLTCHS